MYNSYENRCAEVDYSRLSNLLNREKLKSLSITYSVFHVDYIIITYTSFKDKTVERLYDSLGNFIKYNMTMTGQIS